jgi:hypothetical protein
MMIWTFLQPKATADHLGFLPGFLSEADPDPAAKQIDKHYQHGGGWRGAGGASQWQFNPHTFALKYPGDPAMMPLAFSELRSEKIFFYDYAFVLILQPDGAFEISRVD